MSNKDDLVIQPNGDVVSHATLQSGAIVFDREKRQKLIQIMRQIPAVLDLAENLSQEKTYQAYISPEVLRRIKDGSARFANRDNGLSGANILDVETNTFAKSRGIQAVLSVMHTAQLRNLSKNLSH